MLWSSVGPIFEFQPSVGIGCYVIDYTIVNTATNAPDSDCTIDVYGSYAIRISTDHEFVKNCTVTATARSGLNSITKTYNFVVCGQETVTKSNSTLLSFQYYR
jgi:hypothetical protein